MTDAQQFFDQARKQFNDITGDVERHFELVAGQLREWIPADIPFARPPPPPRRLPPPTTLQLAQRWILRHRALTVAALAFLITGSVGAYTFVRSREHKKKRRARKSASGARTDVVVVAGAVANPLTSALYLDLERRGFVVYVVANTSEDELYIRSQSRIDLIPLHVDLIDPFAVQQQMTRFENLLGREHRAFDEAEPHKLHFAGLILVPDTQGEQARIEEISSEEWSDALNAKVLNTIATTHLFLPSIIEHKAKVLLLTSSITPSLKPPLHAIESTISGALEGFVSTLASELQESGVSVSNFKLGHLDIPSVIIKQRRDGIPASKLKGTPVRKLQDSVFDALVSKRTRRTWHVGLGSLTYELVGNWIPSGIVGRMMGSRRRPHFMKENEDSDRFQESVGSLTWEKVEQEV